MDMLHWNFDKLPTINVDLVQADNDKNGTLAIHRGIEKMGRQNSDSFRKQTKTQSNRKRKTLPDIQNDWSPKVMYTVARKIKNQVIVKQ